MDIPALDSTGDLNWQLMCNENGYYESAEGFEDFIDEMEDLDVDLHDDLDPETLVVELTQEQLYSLAAFNHLAMRYLALFTTDDIESWEDFTPENADRTTFTGAPLGEYTSE